MSSVRDLLLRHAGATVAVLGGGMSLPETLERLPADVVCLSANHHGCLYRRCDYIVALDNIEAQLRPYGVPIIAPHAWADYRMTEHPQLFYSGMQAAWVAWMLGARLILLCGIDCYQGGTYCYAPDEDAPALNRPEHVHARGWRQVKACIPVPIRTLSAPLVPIFGAYDPDEVLPPYVPTERFVLLAHCVGTKVELLQDSGRTREGVRYLRGQILELPRDEAQRLIAMRHARRHIEAAP